MLRRVILILVAALSLAAPARADQTRERWYVLEMMDEHAGWRHWKLTETDNEVVYVDEMKVTINRAGAGIDVLQTATYHQTPKGKPISVNVHTEFSSLSTDQQFDLLDDGIRLTTTQRGETKETMLPSIDGVWLMPPDANAYVAQRLADGADTINVRTIDASQGFKAMTVTYTDIEPTTVELLGRSVKAYKCASHNTLTPGMTSTEYLDQRGELVRSETSMGGIKLTMIASDRELATSDIKAPELMTKVFIRPDKPIPGARTLKKATFVLAVPDGELADLPETGSQAVERIDERTLRVTVDATRFTPAGDVDQDQFLQSSSMLDTGDELIRKLTAEALEGVGESKSERAEALRRFVYRHINKKSLGVGFASASEVARSCEGDCSEHATLLAALLRTDGIPARVASGLVYVDEFAGSSFIFGYHMWTQALLEVDGKQRWVDLDATLPGSLRYDATHIALGLSSLSDGDTVNGLVALAPLMGRLQIQVENLD